MALERRQPYVVVAAGSRGSAPPEGVSSRLPCGGSKGPRLGLQRNGFMKNWARAALDLSVKHYGTHSCVLGLQFLCTSKQEFTWP